MKSRISTLNNREVSEWLVERRLAKHVKCLCSKNGAELVKTPRRKLIQLCGVMDGIRLYNLVQHWHRKETELERQREKLLRYSALLEQQNEEEESSGEEQEEYISLVSVRRALETVTRVQDQRVLVNKRLKNGAIIKVALTDERVAQFANQVY